MHFENRENKFHHSLCSLFPVKRERKHARERRRQTEIEIRFVLASIVYESCEDMQKLHFYKYFMDKKL